MVAEAGQESSMAAAGFGVAVSEAGAAGAASNATE